MTGKGDDLGRRLMVMVQQGVGGLMVNDYGESV